MQRAFTNILSADVERCANFYQNLLGMTRHFDSDWFIILTHEAILGLELGILAQDHEVVPAEINVESGGAIITFVVEDCDAIHAIALELNADIIQPPADMPYGQRRMLLKSPDGMVLDVSAPTAPAPG